MNDADLVSLEVSGIKCDAPGCDWRDDAIVVTDYAAWLNKPCPACGANLLTQDDYDLTMTLIAATKATNAFLNAALPDETKKLAAEAMPERLLRFDMRGDGSLTIRRGEGGTA